MPATVTQAAIAYLDHRRTCGEFAPTTVAATRSCLLSFARTIGDPPPHKLSRRHVEKWVGARRVSPATMRRNLSMLRSFFAWLRQRKMLSRDPLAGIKGPRQPRLIPRGLKRRDVAAVLAACGDRRDVVIVTLMVQCGLRCAEVAGLQVADVDLTADTLHVVGKGGHERALPITADARAALVDYLAEFPAVGGPFVRSYVHTHAGLAPSYISHRVTALLRDAGVKHASYDGVSAHALRHTCAKDLVDGGAGLRDVQSALGHASLTSTSRYVGLTALKDLRRVMEGRHYGRPVSLPPAAGKEGT